MAQYVPALYDSPPESQVSVSIDIGIIPNSYLDAGKYVVTIQALPFNERRDADAVAKALREAIGSRLGIRFDEGTHVS